MCARFNRLSFHTISQAIIGTRQQVIAHEFFSYTKYVFFFNLTRSLSPHRSQQGSQSRSKHFNLQRLDQQPILCLFTFFFTLHARSLTLSPVERTAVPLLHVLVLSSQESEKRRREEKKIFFSQSLRVSYLPP